ncbi:hypothetical protein DY000_02025764 [Brassica cretica]|uniref:Uncharacterized protein n=1 Tax=Brassica cretica TaxID=69181 RepID=A0ABQ7EMF8_BRACR|nr:hypothetical protein DY000_02025764 [Brassica cretica]
MFVCRWNCRTCLLNSSITSSSLRPCDFKLGRVLSSLQRFKCNYSFNFRYMSMHLHFDLFFAGECVGGLDRVEDEGSVGEAFVQIWEREKRGEEFADGVGVAVEVVDDE